MRKGGILNATRPLSRAVTDAALAGGIRNLPGTQNPQYPAAQLGLTDEQVRALIAGSRKVKGFVIPLAAGTIQQTDIDISGTAVMMLGFILFPKNQSTDAANTPRSVNLMVNELEIVRTMPFNLLSKVYNNESDYVEFIQPLSGSDTITLSIDNTGGIAQTIEAAFYYL